MREVKDTCLAATVLKCILSSVFHYVYEHTYVCIASLTSQPLPSALLLLHNRGGIIATTWRVGASAQDIYTYVYTVQVAIYTTNLSNNINNIIRRGSGIILSKCVHMIYIG